MKVILSNGTELETIVATGSRRNVHGANRDSLAFVFPASTGMEALNELFTAENCESITLIENKSTSYIHNGYTIRAELSQASVVVQQETAETEAVYEDRITVVMAQRTYMESQVVAMKAAIEMMCMEDVE